MFTFTRPLQTVALLLLLAVAATFVGCEPTQTTRQSNEELIALANSKFGGEDFIIGIIPGSTGAFNEGLVGIMSSTSGPSSLVKDTIRRIAVAHDQNQHILYTGRSPEKTKAVVTESLSHFKDNALQGMKFHIVGGTSAELQKQAQRVGVQLID